MGLGGGNYSSDFMQYFNNPMMRQMMESVMDNPAMMDAMISNNPELKEMVA